MYLIYYEDSYLKDSYLKQGKRIYLPYGFHLLEDLVPLYQMRDDCKRDSLSRGGKLRLKEFQGCFEKTFQQPPQKIKRYFSKTQEPLKTIQSMRVLMAP